MARDWIPTFRCAPARRPARLDAGGGAGRTHRPRPPCPRAAPREGARFTYGVYLQESLEVPDAVDLTVLQPLNYLAGDLGFLQAEPHGQGQRRPPERLVPGPQAPPPPPDPRDATFSIPIHVCPLQKENPPHR